MDKKHFSMAINRSVQEESILSFGMFTYSCILNRIVFGRSTYFLYCFLDFNGFKPIRKFIFFYLIIIPKNVLFCNTDFIIVFFEY